MMNYFNLLSLFILIGTVHIQYSSQCSKSIPPESPDEYIEGLLGGSATTSSITDGRNFENIASGDELACSFDSVCQWGSDGDHENPWYKVSGNPDPKLWKRYTGTTEMPEGEFAIHAKVANKESDWLMSDFIGCQEGGGFLEMRYWLFDPASFKVCTVPVGSFTGSGSSSRQTLWCSQEIDMDNPLGAGPGEYTGIDIPDQDQQFMIAIVPINDGGFVAIDDLYYDAADVQCLEPTTELPETLPPATDVPSDEVNCDKIPCDFNSGGQCAWASLGATSGATRTFDTYDESIGPILTGVRWSKGSPGYDGKYAGVKLNGQGDNGAGGDTAIMVTDGLAISDPRILRMRYYEATSGQQVRVAVDTIENVVWESNRHVTVSDRNWQTAEIPLESGVNKIFIIGDNIGDNIGAIGVDDIELLVPRSGGGTNACG